GSDPSCSSGNPGTGNNNGDTGGNNNGGNTGGNNNGGNTGGNNNGGTGGGGSNEQPDPKAEEWPEDCEEIYSIRSGMGDQPHTVRAGTETHPQFYFDAPWGDDPVQALAFKPITDNKKVMHHWIL